MKLARNQKNFAILMILVGFVLLVFGRTLEYPILWWDDRAHICQNPFLNPPTLAGLWHLWTHAYFGLYAPLSYTLWAFLADISRTFFGGASNCMEWGPAFHALNLILHAVNTVLAFFLLKKLVPARNYAAFFGALLFAIHPLQVESVAWISGGRDLLSLLFGFSALILLIDERWLFASLLMILSCLAKATGVVFPILGLVILLEAGKRKQLVMLIPSLCFGILAGVAAKFIQQEPELFEYPFWQRPLIFAQSLGFYLWKLILPVDLVPDYGRSPADLSAHPEKYFMATLFLVLMALCYIYRKRIRILPLLWIVIALIPVSGLVSFGFQSISTVADHYFYGAMFGISLLLVKLWPSQPKKYLAAAALGLVLLWSGLSFYQAGFWQNDETLFQQNALVTPSSYISHANLGNVFFHHGKFPQAETEFRQSLELNPGNHMIKLDLARSLESQNRILEARQVYDEAIQSGHARPEIFNNLGTLEYREGHLIGAERLWKEAAARSPEYIDPRYNLGMAFLDQGRVDEARQILEEAARIAPQNPMVQEKLRSLPPK